MRRIRPIERPMTAARPLALTRNIVLEPVAPGLERLKGRVASHRQRKRLHLEVSHARPTRVVNELAVVARAPVKPRRLLGELKRDGFLAGVPFSLGETPPYSGLFHVELNVDAAATVTLDGRVPDQTYRSYLETRLWRSPGVERVINRTAVVDPDDAPADVDEVVARLLTVNPRLPVDIVEQVSVDFDHDAVALAGTVEDAGELSEIERDAWAVPQVAAVTSDIEVQRAD